MTSNFIDEAELTVFAGKGGNGCLSFHRARCEPKGGPDGGDGGKGGDVIFYASSGVKTLRFFRKRRLLLATNGKHGMGDHRKGASGVDLKIAVPLGTQIFDSRDEAFIADLKNEGEICNLVIGGRGGAGNARYKSSINRAPRKYTEGLPGESRNILMRLKVLSDVGLTGLPNAGKSSFLNACARNVNAKVGDYPFTTVGPKLGLVETDEKSDFVIADLPGLIAGANSGKGLGTRFLKHVERCQILLHLVDGASENFLEDYYTVDNELKKSSDILKSKKRIVVLSKVDLLSKESIAMKISLLKNTSNQPVYPVSSVSKSGIVDIIDQIAKDLSTHRAHKNFERNIDFDPYD